MNTKRGALLLLVDPVPGCTSAQYSEVFLEFGKLFLKWIPLEITGVCEEIGLSLTSLSGRESCGIVSRKGSLVFGGG